jgi:hypothetical protein
VAWHGRNGKKNIKGVENTMSKITKERVEKTLRRKLNGQFREFIGPRYRYNDPLPESSVIDYNFNHLKK